MYMVHWHSEYIIIGLLTTTWHCNWPQFNCVKEVNNTASVHWSLTVCCNEIFTSQNVTSVYCNLKLLTLTFSSPPGSIHIKDFPFHSLACLPIFLISSRLISCWCYSLSPSAILVSFIHFLNLYVIWVSSKNVFIKTYEAQLQTLL